MNYQNLMDLISHNTKAEQQYFSQPLAVQHQIDRFADSIESEETLQSHITNMQGVIR